MSLPDPVPELPDCVVQHARLLSNRHAMLSLLPKQMVVAEIGVGLGVFSQELLRLCEPRRFIGIDTFRLHELDTLWGTPTSEHFGNLSHRDWYCSKFKQPIDTGRMQVIEGDSATMLRTLDDRSLDVIYIDGDHSYEGVKRDLDAASHKVKQGGVIIVNDYVLVDSLNASQAYGVIYASNEFMMENSWGIEYLALQTNMFCDVVLRELTYFQEKEKINRDYLEENEKLRLEVHLLRSSTSWRLTKPIRAIAQLFQRLPQP